MIKRFLSDETGAITVDWTVMTAAIVGLGLASAAAVRTGTLELGADIEATLSNASVARLNFAEVRHSFASNIDGLSVVRNGNSSQISWSSMAGPDGQPGVMVFADNAGGDAMVDLGPTFAGDQSDKYGGTLTWDVNILATGGPLVRPDELALIEIRGQNGETLIYRAAANPPVGEWAQVGGTIQAGDMRLSNGTLASEEQIRAVLANVQQTAVRVEYVNGGFGVEQIAFDNFRFR